MGVCLDDIELLEQLAIQEARESFWAYRRFMNPKMKVGWWQKEMAAELQLFYEQLSAGKRPKLVIEAPPQHGKSKMSVEFITWVAGKNPDLKTIYTSFSERLGVRANLQTQRILESERFKKVFPDTQINSVGMSAGDAKNATRNREMLEYVGRDGFFRNTTVRGSITGESLDIGVIENAALGHQELVRRHHGPQGERGVQRHLKRFQIGLNRLNFVRFSRSLFNGFVYFHTMDRNVLRCLESQANFIAANINS